MYQKRNQVIFLSRNVRLGAFALPSIRATDPNIRAKNVLAKTNCIFQDEKAAAHLSRLTSARGPHHSPPLYRLLPTAQANFERALLVWEAARAKHQRLLRPAFGSADRRGELDELLATEAERAAEATAAIASFSRELVREEAAVTKEHAEKVSCCFSGVAAILDR